MLAENMEQRKAIQHFNGPCMVIAPPGSGKTFTMIKRIRYLIEERKVPPSEILVVTFTKAAAEEMKKRFSEECSGQYYTSTFGTFHAVYFYILKEQYSYTYQNIITPSEKREILKTVILTLELEDEYDENTIEELLSEIEKKKNKLCLKNETSMFNAFEKIYIAYEAEKRKRKKLDFDDITILCYQLFSERKEVLEFWQKRYRYLLIDEFQDINEMQFEVIRMLAGNNGNLFVVGDDDQAIYGFRGANPDIMLKLPKIYPAIEKIVLSVNYRSIETIVEASKRVILKNKNRFEKNCKAYRKGGSEIKFFEAESKELEKEYLISEISQRDNNEVAVIFRTNKGAALFAELLTKERIPFCLKVDVKSFYQHFVIKDIFAYLQFAFEGQKREDFLRIMNKPLRYLSRNSLHEDRVEFSRLKKFYEGKDVMQARIDRMEKDVLMLSELPLYAGIHYIRKGMGYDAYLKKYALETSTDFKEYEEILTELQERSREQKSIKEWLYEIQVYEKGLERELQNKRNKIEEGVKLITMHASKGLEFHTVIIPEVIEGNMPYKKAQTKEELEEERRLFYVAMTRAREELILSFTRKNQDTSKEISRFFLDMELIPRP